MPALLSDAQTACAMVANPDWARRLGWSSYASAISILTRAQSPDPAQPAFASAIADWQKQGGLFVDGILGPATWKEVRKALAPTGVLTNIFSTNAPAVPAGFEAIIRAFGDPRSLMAPDGTITADNRLTWERQILARGKLPFPIPISDATGARTRW